MSAEARAGVAAGHRATLQPALAPSPDAGEREGEGGAEGPWARRGRSWSGRRRLNCRELGRGCASRRRRRRPAGVGETPGAAAAANRHPRPAEPPSQPFARRRGKGRRGGVRLSFGALPVVGKGPVWGEAAAAALRLGRGVVSVNSRGSESPSGGEIVRLGLPPVCVGGFVERAETTASRRPGRCCAAGKLLRLFAARGKRAGGRPGKAGTSAWMCGNYPDLMRVRGASV